MLSGFAACSPIVSPDPVDLINPDQLQDAILVCVDIGEDENLIPRSEVYVWIIGEKVYIDNCTACRPISKDAYSSHDIPEKALSACGGWYAGGGDYFYAIKHKNTIEVYSGWQDEGQMEDNDTTFHWGLDTAIVYQ